MRELIERFAYRYQIWREEHRAERGHHDRNPLIPFAIIAVALVAWDIYGAISSHHIEWRTIEVNLLFIAFLVLCIMPVDSPAFNVLCRFGGLALLLTWYFNLAKRQIQYVKKILPAAYERKPPSRHESSALLPRSLRLAMLSAPEGNLHIGHLESRTACERPTMLSNSPL